MLSEIVISGAIAKSSEDGMSEKGRWIEEVDDQKDKAGDAMISGERGSSKEEDIKDGW